MLGDILVELNAWFHPTGLLCELSQPAHPFWVKWGFTFFLWYYEGNEGVFLSHGLKILPT